MRALVTGIDGFAGRHLAVAALPALPATLDRNLVLLAPRGAPADQVAVYHAP